MQQNNPLQNSIPAKVLAANTVSKRFGGIQALDRVSLDIRAGEVHALVGENGAGKSTLMKILAGIYQDYEGQLLLDEKPVRFDNPRMALEHGIAMIHQELNLIPHLSIAENIFLGREFLNAVGWVDRRRTNRETMLLLSKLDLQVAPETPIRKLRVGQQQLVEIAKALSLKARVIIMDEPTSAISDREVDILFRLIRELAQRGVAIVYISHKLDEVFRISDRISVLRDGEYVDTFDAETLAPDRLIPLMVGRDVEDFFVTTETRNTTQVLRLEDICLGHPTRPGEYLVDHVSLSVARGEVLGVFGLMGAGRSELLETLFGIHPGKGSGHIWVEGQAVSIRHPQEAIRAGLALVPEDRKVQGLVLGMSVRDSISLANIQLAESYGFLNRRREESLARDYIQRLQIKTANEYQIIKNLSGGNQQKVVIAKWLATHPKVLLLDEPTRGIDVNAKNEIYKLVGELAAGGMAIVMVSSELPEILTMAHRIVVFSEGRLTLETTREAATEESLLHAALPRHTQEKSRI